MFEARFRKSLEMSRDTEATSSKRKLRKYESAKDATCAFETHDLNLTIGNFDPCEFTLHTAIMEKIMTSKKHVCFLQHMNMCEKNGDH
jgi:hypothetical protein